MHALILILLIIILVEGGIIRILVGLISSSLVQSLLCAIFKEARHIQDQQK